jgi:hypothetical protein
MVQQKIGGPLVGVDDALVGVYVGRVLGDAKPRDLPVQQVAKIEFVLNLNTHGAWSGCPGRRVGHPRRIDQIKVYICCNAELRL